MPPTKLTSLLLISIFSLLLHPLFSLNSDGTYLLAFRYSILSDPLDLLRSWNFLDQNPCAWTGVECSDELRVVGLSLPNSRLLGSIPPDVGFIDTLRHVDLSRNFLNGTLPATLLNASALQALSLSSNVISGELPVFSSSSLSFLNLSDNAIGGKLRANFSSLFKNLTVLSLRGNYFSGDVPAGFGSLEVLDLSANLFNGSLPSDLGGSGLRYLNLSYNKIFGRIPEDFAAGIPENATIDLSFNNLTGQIPAVQALVGQDSELFSGNQDLCGKPLKNLCTIPSTLSTPPNLTASVPPAIAVIPKSLDSRSDTNSSSDAAASSHTTTNNVIKPATIVGITLANLAGLVILGATFFYLYRLRNKKHMRQQQQNPIAKTGQPPEKKNQMFIKDYFSVQVNTSNAAAPDKHTKCLSNCLRGEESEEGATSDARTSSESEDSYDGGDPKERRENGCGGGALVMVDGETELEVETLLKASAYILGASGSSIVYKAVLQNGTTFTVRRLGVSAVEKLRDFEAQVKTIAKLRHPNLVRIRGFYWGSDEKLVIYDYVSNGSLASSTYKKNGSTPYHLPLLARLKIARGVARGLAYIHEKRFVHSNIKPSNILLTPDMEPIIGDLGLSWLVHGRKVGGSGRQFGSKRSYDTAQDLPVTGSPYSGPFSYPNECASPYQAPESLKNLKPNPKWDVYSFGIVLLELLTGKVYLDKELGQWTPSVGLEDRYWVLRMAEGRLRGEIQGKEETMVSIFKLGFSCASLVPQKRPSMKEALQVLDKLPLSCVE